MTTRFNGALRRPKEIEIPFKKTYLEKVFLKGISSFRTGKVPVVAKV